MLQPTWRDMLHVLVASSALTSVILSHRTHIATLCLVTLLSCPVEKLAGQQWSSHSATFTFCSRSCWHARPNGISIFYIQCTVKNGIAN